MLRSWRSAGLIAFSAPRGAGSLPRADFTELGGPGQGEPALTVLLCGDNDEKGRKAMRKVSTLLKKNHHLDTTDRCRAAEKGGSVADLAVPEKGGSVADLPADDLQDFTPYPTL